MTLLLYAITDCPEPVLTLPAGVDGQPVQCIVSSGMSALVSRHVGVPKLDEPAAWAYERVIESAMAGAAVAPARFVSTLADAAAVEQMLDDRAGELRDILDRIRGRVEVSVRAVWTDDPRTRVGEPTPEAGTGTRYLLARSAPTRRTQALRDHIQARLGPLSHASRFRMLCKPSVLLSAAFLVDDHRTDEFIRQASQLDVELEDAELICTGPWPAFSFAGGGSS